MRVQNIQLKNFKRFTDLTIQNIPETAKLLLLIGSNGSGKSSIFDAFEFFNSIGKNYPSNPNYLYYRKNKNKNIEILIKSDSNQGYYSNEINSTVSGSPFYGRTSFRQLSRLTKTHSGEGSIDLTRDSDRPRYYIDKDKRFENDLEKIQQEIISAIFKLKLPSEQIQEKYVVPINNALKNIFDVNPENILQLIEIIPPLDGNIAQINFQKGNTTIHYNFLSAGEKEVFNILLNLLSRKDFYANTIIFIDELDLHLNTKLQYNLLKEITENWIPDNSQLWTASHSLGFIEYANEAPHAAIIDFDDLNFDLPQVLDPTQKNNYEVFELAVSNEFLDKLFQNKKIVFSENTDTPLYNDLSLRETIFFKAVDKNDVFQKTKNHPNYRGLIDRDYLLEEDISAIKKAYSSLSVLPYYSIENLLFHPDNLEEYCAKINKQFDKASYIQSITKIKNENKDTLNYGIRVARDGYPFFKENENAKNLKEFKERGHSIVELLSSNDFETFYKVFPAKDYGKSIPERQNLNRKELAQTAWFKNQIEKTLSN